MPIVSKSHRPSLVRRPAVPMPTRTWRPAAGSRAYELPDAPVAEPSVEGSRPEERLRTPAEEAIIDERDMDEAA